MTTLRVILDPVLDRNTAGARYTDRVVRSLIGTAPEGSRVAGVLSATSDGVSDSVERGFPGLASVHRARLARRELRAAWQHGITVIPGDGLLHATDLSAPLGRHDRQLDPDSQVVVTIADAMAWTEPERLDPREVSRRRAMGRRAARYADAVVVPSRSVADSVDSALSLGDRIRVIAAAARPGFSGTTSTVGPLTDPPERYVVAVLGDSEAPGTTIRDLGELLPDGTGVVVVGDGSALEAPVPGATLVPGVDEPALMALVRRSTALVHLGGEVGFGLAILDAMSLGIPVVHPDTADAYELVADAGLAVALDRGAAGMAEAIIALQEDDALASRLATLGRDRARAFTWRDTAEKIWQLHADL